MSVLRRMIMIMDGFNIDTIPSSRKIYYTASEKIVPKENSLGSKVLVNMYSATTMDGVLVTENDITSIGERAFYNCISLTSITIPNTVTFIGFDAFRSCKSLTSVYCKAATPPSLDADVFYYNGSGRKIYVPTESVEAYKSARNWSGYADAIEGYEF